MLIGEQGWLLAAWICFIGFQVIVFKMENLPLGVHQWDITIRSTMRQAKVRILPLHYIRPHTPDSQVTVIIDDIS